MRVKSFRVFFVYDGQPKKPYVLGSILVLAAVVLLVTKKRMGEKN